MDSSRTFAKSVCAVVLVACSFVGAEGWAQPVLESPCEPPCQVACLPGLELCDGECRSPDALACRCPGCRAPLGGAAVCERGRCSWTCEPPAARCGEGCCRLVAKGSYTCFADVAGDLSCWGANDTGQLADGTRRPARTPQRLAHPSRVEALAGSLYSVCAAWSGGVGCWGWHSQGAGPVAIQAAPVVGNLVAGQFHFCGIDRGAVSCWGRARGMAGLLESSTLAAVRVPGLEAGVAEVAPGGDHTCAVDVAGAVHCWGANAEGQLGTGDTVDRLYPTQVVGLPEPAVHVAAARWHTCAVLESGKVSCWGEGTRGQLGGRASSSRPVLVPGLTGAARLALGDNSSCALLGSGAVWCWGSNGYGELGHGDTEEHVRPVPVVGFATKGAVALASGSHHWCLLTREGGVRCWGYNEHGQVGDGSTERRHRPVPVSLP